MERSIIDLLINDCRLHRLADESIKNPEYRDITAKMHKVYDKFLETLTEEQKELLNKYDDLEYDEQIICNESYFILVVKIGVRLLAECMFD